MNIQDEERWKENDHRAFQIMEYERTTKAHEPLPEGAIIQVKKDSAEIFGSQFEKDAHLCADCGMEFRSGEERDKHFMSPDCQMRGHWDSLTKEQQEKQ